MNKTTTRLNRLIKVFMLLGLFGFSRQLLAQSGPDKQWDKSFGGSSDDEILSMKQTTDGGYILGGMSYSGISGDKTQASQGDKDYWVVKLDANGAKTWDKTFGGSGYDDLLSLQQTSDGGYILGGYSNSGISGDKTQASQGSFDYWVVKLDASGNISWDKTFGGSAHDELHSLQQTSDGGYILGGYSASGISGDKSQASQGSFDYWVVKLDASGNISWDKTFGGSNLEMFYSLQQTSDGGYILGGYSASGISGDKTQANKNGDYWVVRLDASGNISWDKTFGSSGYDELISLQQTSDGGYILGGYSASGISGDKTQASQGSDDYWVVKLNASGNISWDKTFGGSSEDYLFSLQQTSDGGYILGGESKSGISGDKTQANNGPSHTQDYWVVKLDASGNKTWDKTFGGNSVDRLFSLQQTSDGGYILGGISQSDISGDKTQASQGSFDFWVVKLAAEVPLPVSWLYFNGKNTVIGTELTWATATEKNSASFVIERSENCKNFEVIGAVKATGNSNQQLIYSFTDKNQLAAAKTYYRLKQTDLDGTFAYSTIITVNKGKYGVLEASAYPNPFNEVLHLQTSAPEKIRQVVLLSIDGKELYRKNINQTTDLKLTDLPVLKSGLYFLRLSGDNGMTTLKVNRQ